MWRNNIVDVLPKMYLVLRRHAEVNVRKRNIFTPVFLNETKKYNCASSEFTFFSFNNKPPYYTLVARHKQNKIHWSLFFQSDVQFLWNKLPFYKTVCGNIPCLCFVLLLQLQLSSAVPACCGLSSLKSQALWKLLQTTSIQHHLLSNWPCWLAASGAQSLLS